MARPRRLRRALERNFAPCRACSSDRGRPKGRVWDMCCMQGRAATACAFGSVVSDRIWSVAADSTFQKRFHRGTWRVVCYEMFGHNLPKTTRNLHRKRSQCWPGNFLNTQRFNVSQRVAFSRVAKSAFGDSDSDKRCILETLTGAFEKRYTFFEKLPKLLHSCA